MVRRGYVCSKRHDPIWERKEITGGSWFTVWKGIGKNARSGYSRCDLNREKNKKNEMKEKMKEKRRETESLPLAQ